MFSMYDELPLLLDHEGWYSVTPERIAIQIAERLRCGSASFPLRSKHFVSFGQSKLTFSLPLLVLQPYSMPFAAWEATRSLSRRPASEVRPLLCAVTIWFYVLR